MSERVIRLVRPPDEGGVGVFLVRVGRTTTHYTLHEIPCEIGGRGFVVHKLGLGSTTSGWASRRIVPASASASCGTGPAGTSSGSAP
jgi:hypothetical protein